MSWIDVLLLFKCQANCMALKILPPGHDMDDRQPSYCYDMHNYKDLHNPSQLDCLIIHGLIIHDLIVSW